MDYIIYFVVTIGILVFVHEFGHFAAAKICKMRTDVFAIGFGKRLFGWNKISKFTWGDLPKDFDTQGYTDYRLSLLPLGGYVKISGMIDESFDTKFISSEPQPWEFRSKPTIQKLFVITAGVLMNLLLTLVVFWGINFFQGKQIVDTTRVGVVKVGTMAEQVGFKSNDQILKVNNIVVKNWDEVLDHLLIRNYNGNIKVKVLRDGREIELSVPAQKINKASQDQIFLSPDFFRPVITQVWENSPAEASGIKANDFLLKIKDIDVKDGNHTIELISANKNIEVPVVLLRGVDTVLTKVTPGPEGKIGISIGDIYTGPVKYESFGFFKSFTQSFSNIYQYTALTLGMLKKVIVGEIAFSSAFGGPVKIAQFAVKSADSGITSFLFFLAMLSLSLAIINILPFPVLDGGHFVIILIEGIFKKEIPIKIKIAIQNAGFVLLLLLMAFIIYSDLMSL
ncbi:MAG: RIP metalloprotease RseP [bacterium]